MEENIKPAIMSNIGLKPYSIATPNGSTKIEPVNIIASDFITSLSKGLTAVQLENIKTGEMKAVDFSKFISEDKIAVSKINFKVQSVSPFQYTFQNNKVQPTQDFSNADEIVMNLSVKNGGIGGL